MAKIAVALPNIEQSHARAHDGEGLSLVLVELEGVGDEVD
jgi:hypothetical protein